MSLVVKGRALTVRDRALLVAGAGGAPCCCGGGPPLTCDCSSIYIRGCGPGIWRECCVCPREYNLLITGTATYSQGITGDTLGGGNCVPSPDGTMLRYVATWRVFVEVRCVGQSLVYTVDPTSYWISRRDEWFTADGNPRFITTENLDLRGAGVLLSPLSILWYGVGFPACALPNAELVSLLNVLSDQADVPPFTDICSYDTTNIIPAVRLPSGGCYADNGIPAAGLYSRRATVSCGASDYNESLTYFKGYIGPHGGAVEARGVGSTSMGWTTTSLGQACPPDTCPNTTAPTGACCGSFPGPFGGARSCVIVPASTCANMSGSYRGNGVPCSAANCPPLAPCCLPNGGCAMSTQAACVLNRGRWLMPGSTCADCNPIGYGACCLPDRTCVPKTELDCRAIVGATFLGVGYPCPASGQCGTVVPPISGMPGDTGARPSGGIVLPGFAPLLGGCAGCNDGGV